MQNSIRTFLKWALLRVFFYSGAFRLVRFFRRDRITILMIHGVIPRGHRGDWQPLWARLDLEAFDFGLSIIQKYYTVISIDEAEEILQARALPVSHGLVLTFDDGYRNLLTQAYPRLARYDLSAVAYIATGYMEGRRSYWIDRLDYVLQQGTANIELQIGPHQFEIDRTTRQALIDSYAKCRRELKTLYVNDAAMHRDLDKAILELEQRDTRSIQELDNDQYSATLSWTELSTLDDNGVVIGSHTVSHYRLPTIETPVVEDELLESKRTIESALGNTCEHFCYPNGDYSPSVCDSVRKAGYKTAVSTDSGLNAIGDDLFELKRIAFPETYSTVAFLWRISGLSDGLKSILKIRRTA